jgi:predicted negative regulator of RcsB-dependent stress response
MQTQDAPAEILFKLWPWLEANKNRLIGVAVAIVVVAGVYYFVSAEHEQKEIAAGEALTQLLLTPATTSDQSADALVGLASKYSGTEAAKRAQLQGAASLFDAARYADAQAQFQKFLESNAGGPLAATAELGVGASLEAQGKADLAATAYQKVISSYPGTPSVLPAYCGLGRIAEAQGRLSEALNNYEGAVRSGGAGGSLAQMANLKAYEIKAKLDAAPHAPAAPTVKPSLTPTLVAPAK